MFQLKDHCHSPRTHSLIHPPSSRLDVVLQKTIALRCAPVQSLALDPAIVHGKPVIRGTRLPVTVVVESLAGGMTFEEVQREYDLTADDIRAAVNS